MTNGTRHRLSLSSFSLNNLKIKKLSSGFKKNSGRSNLGRITVFSKGSRSHNYMIVDYTRLTSTDVAVCLHNVKNTCTNNILSLLKFSNGSYSYILNTYGYFVGMYTQFLTRHSIFSTKYNLGDVVFLKNLQIGCIFFGVCNLTKNKTIYARSPGTYCTLLSNDDNNLLYRIQLPSGSCVIISGDYSVTLGRNSNIWRYKEVTGKAGRNVKRGCRPSVRGVAMNPVDHPHGGRTKTNSPEKTPWGKITKFNK